MHECDLCRGVEGVLDRRLNAATDATFGRIETGFVPSVQHMTDEGLRKTSGCSPCY